MGMRLPTLRMIGLFRRLVVAGAVLMLIYLSIQHFWGAGGERWDDVIRVIILIILGPVVALIALSIAERSVRREAATAQELEQRLQELSALNQMAQRILAERTDYESTTEILRKENLVLSTIHSAYLVGKDSREILTITLDKLLEVMEFDAAEVFVVDKQRNTLVLTAHRGLFPDSFYTVSVLQVGKGFPGLAVQSGRPIMSLDIATDPRFVRQAIVEKGIHFFISVPLKMPDSEEIIGTMGLASRRIGSLNERELDMLETLGRVLATTFKILKPSEVRDLMSSP